MPSPFTTFVSSTDIEELIETELIDSFVETYQRGPNLARTLGFVFSVPRGSAPTIRLPRFNELDLTSTSAQSQGDYFSEVEITTTEESATLAVVGVQLPIARQAADDASPRGIPAGLITELMDAMWARIETDAWGVVDSSAVQYDNSAGAFTSQSLRNALATWRGTLPKGKPLVCISLAAATTLIESIASSGATMAPDMSSLYASIPGYLGDLHGASIFTSTRLPVNSTVVSGFIVDSARLNRGIVIAMAHPPKIELVPRPEAYSDIVVCSARFGCTIGNNSATRGAVTEILLQS